MHSSFLQLGYEDRRTEGNEGTKRRIFVAFFIEIPQTDAESMYNAAHKETQCLSCLASYCTAHLLYKYCTSCPVCDWTVLTVITPKLLLHVQLHNSTAHLLYKYCTNSTFCNWTVLTLTTQKLLQYVQLHEMRETVQLMSSEAECCRLLDNVCVYTDRQSHPEIRFFRQLQMTVNGLPQFHSFTQHMPTFLSGDCRTAYVSNWSLTVGWRNSGTWGDQTMRGRATGFKE